ncbi:MAG: glycosyltransferase family 1 protein [Elusimicrobia bacterium]|nr:glycosyltransferase family 1 protein [Elusimicrobiota bacterium]
MNTNVLFLFSDSHNQVLNYHYDFMGKFFKKAVRINFTEYFCRNGIINTEKYIKKFIQDNGIELVISSPYASIYDLSVDFYRSLRKLSRIVFFMGDDENYFDYYSRYYCQTADAVITTDFFSIPAYKKLGIPAILYFTSYSEKTLYPVKTEKDIDVSFLGDCTKNDRMEFINFLLDNNINVETFGRGSSNGFVEWNEFPKIFSRSRINLNFTKVHGMDWINLDKKNPSLKKTRQNKGRPIEIALTKSFCLSESAPSLKEVFDIGTEIDAFNTKEELLEKVNFYLSDGKKREEMAQKAYERASREYKSEIYIPKILKELESILSGTARTPEEKEIFLSTRFKENTINGLTFSMFILIKNGKLGYALELFMKLFKYGIPVFIKGFYRGFGRALKMLNK